jgi:pimeloyl-ACP methyl ester carboxylesterase
MTTTARTLRSINGRTLRILDAGPQEGIPILVHNGTPGSALLYDIWVKDAQSRGIRLISYDRPGYGGSTPQAGRDVADAANDVAAIAEQLRLERMATWGVSGGGPHALACAAWLPDLIRAAAVVASPAPYKADGLDRLGGMGEDNIAEFNAATNSREALQAFTEAAGAGLLGADLPGLLHGLRSLLSEVDAAALTDEFGAYLLSAVREGIGQRKDGWVDDDLAFVAPWGFDLASIRIPVMLLQRQQDHFIPPPTVNGWPAESQMLKHIFFRAMVISPSKSTESQKFTAGC